MKIKRRQIERSGFTLIEVVVSISIFAIIIGGIIQFSVKSIEASTKSKAMQEAIDNARYAIDDLAKKVRTSSNISLSGGNKELFFVDNLTRSKYCYRIENGKMTVASYEVTLDDHGMIAHEDVYQAIKKCSDLSSTANEVIGSAKTTVDGHFQVMPTDISGNNPRRGFVRINVNIAYKKQDNSPSGSAVAHLQTGVSILDYNLETDPLAVAGE